MLLDTNVQLLRDKQTNKNTNTKAYKDMETYSPFKGKTDKPTKASHEKDQMEDLLHKDFKTTVLKMLTKLKKNVEKANCV